MFGSHETSDAWADASKARCSAVRSGVGSVMQLVIYLDNGSENSVRRTQFLKRMVTFADYSGLEVRSVYYPPYHRKYNPVERSWSALEQKWGVYEARRERSQTLPPYDITIKPKASERQLN